MSDGHTSSHDDESTPESRRRPWWYAFPVSHALVGMVTVAVVALPLLASGMLGSAKTTGTRVIATVTPAATTRASTPDASPTALPTPAPSPSPKATQTPAPTKAPVRATPRPVSKPQPTFPSASNTGVPSGTKFTPCPATVTQNGAVIKDCSGTELDITANDVTVEDVLLTPNYWQMGLWFKPGYHGLLVKNVTVYFSIDEGNNCMALEGPATVESVYLHGYCQQGIYVTASGVTVSDSYINILDAPPGNQGFAPDVGIRVSATTVSASTVVSGVTIRHDTVITQATSDPTDECGPLAVGGYGSVSNLMVEDNLLQGANTLVELIGPGTNRSVINNEFSKQSLQKIWNVAGQYTIAHNVWAHTSTPVPGP
jgi:hypothetical protein